MIALRTGSRQSRYFGKFQLAAINRIGDSMLPGSSELPRFSKTGCVSQIDRVLDFMPEQDRKDLGILVFLFAFLPGPFIAGLLSLIEAFHALPLPFVGGLVRLIRLGLRGLIMTLYYSDHGVQGRIGYQVSVFRGDH